MADPMFVIPLVFLVLGAGLGGYVVYHKQTVMVPLEMQEKAEIEAMNCEEVKIKHELGQYWSFTNWKIANEKVKSCAK
ncbi:MAG TPA: hypothetical protein VNK25_02965 [Candidatus Nitrosotenuis sp.]|jgi:hypothetical protein|nr:hypothetical protein [Candidatus Nitrosotenuis sp.]